MKKIKLLAILFCFFSLLSCAEKKLTIDKRDIDLGKLRIFEDKKIIIPLKNNSSSIIKIFKVKTSCKCLLNSTINKNIEIYPDSVYKLDLIYKSNEIGKFKETIVIYNDSNEPFEIINIKSNVL